MAYTATPTGAEQNSLSARAHSAWDATRREATPPRLAAAGALALGAAAAGYLWDAGRRERLTDNVRDLSGRVSERLGMHREHAPTAAEIKVA